MSKPEIVAIAPLPGFLAIPLHENFTVHDLHGAADSEARRALIAKIAPTTRGMAKNPGSGAIATISGLDMMFSFRFQRRLSNAVIKPASPA